MRKKFLIVFTLVLALTMTIGTLSASAGTTNKAVFAVYKAQNNLNLSMKKDDSGQIKGVYKVTFSYKGKEDMKKFEKIFKNFSMSKLSPASVNWESSNEKVATVSSYGKVKAKKKGTCYVCPVPKNTFFSKYKGKFIWYVPGKIGGSVRAYGGIGAKITVTK